MTKPLHIFLFFSVVFLHSNFGYSQLFQENFSSTTINNTSLNTAGGTNNHNSVSWSSSGMYFFNHSTDEDCDDNYDWAEYSAHNSGFGTEPSGASGYRAGILAGNYGCTQDQSLITAKWTPTSNVVSISFSYSFKTWGYGSLNIYLQRSSDGGYYQNVQTLVSTSSNASADFSSSVNVVSGDQYRLVFHYNGTWDYGASIDTILVEESALISVGSSITGLDYILGNGPSASQSTTVSGSNLEGDITVSAPTNFEVSTDNTNFSDSVTLGESAGTVSSTTIHARLKSGLSVDSYSGNITASSTNASSQTIALSGSVPTPTISVGSAITGLNYASGSGPSTSQSTTVAGTNLGGSITVAAPTNFEVSTDNSSFADSVVLSPSNGTVNSTTIHVRLKSGLSINNYSGNITCSTTSGSNQTIALSGTSYNGDNSSVNYYVDDNGSDSNNGLTDSTPFATLSQAISTATNGTANIINVGAGTYTEHTVNVNKSNLTIRGTGSSSTVFDCDTTNKGFMSITASNVAVEKIKIKDYNFTSASTTDNAYGGGGIRVGATPGTAEIDTSLSGITITDVYFKDNS